MGSGELSGKPAKKRKSRATGARKGQGHDEDEEDGDDQSEYSGEAEEDFTASVGEGSSSAATASGGSGTSLNGLDLKPELAPSPISPITDDVKDEDMKDIGRANAGNSFVTEQPTPSGLTTASLLYGLAWGDSARAPVATQSTPNLVSTSGPSAHEDAFGFARANVGGNPILQSSNTTSSLGLDIPMPSHAFQAGSSHTFPVPSDIPSFVQAAQQSFPYFQAQPSGSIHHQPSAAQPLVHQQHQQQSGNHVDIGGHVRHLSHSSTFSAGHGVGIGSQIPPIGSESPAMVANPTLGQPQSFLARGAGSPYPPQFFQFGHDSAVAQQIGQSRSYSPDDRPSTAASSAESYLYAGSTSDSASASLASSVHSLAATLPLPLPMPPTFSSVDGYDAFHLGPYTAAENALQHSNPFLNPTGIGQHSLMSQGHLKKQNEFGFSSMNMDESSKYHFQQLLMQQTDGHADEFLQWPSREASPALASLGFSPDNTTHSIESSNSPSNASYRENSMHDYEAQAGNVSQMSLFADKTITAAAPSASILSGAESPIASLEEWLLRQANENMYD